MWLMSRRWYLEMDVVKRWHWMGGGNPFGDGPKSDIEHECRELWREAEDRFLFESNLFQPFCYSNTNANPVNFAEAINTLRKSLGLVERR
jgi:hypothetical protein